MNEKKKLYGFYSEQAYHWYGVAVYSTPDGKTVEVTAVYDTMDAPEYKYSDKKFIGEVVDCLKGAPAERSKWCKYES